ncbi:MAG TPA: ABC transporter permease [Nakamurella sp.]|jgi:NitT/TauT family transport system permease protein|nr:ABC transporter permease [Nakamurella sp.]
MLKKARVVTDPLIFLVAIVVVWQLVTVVTGIHSVLLPSPLAVGDILTTRFGLLLSSMLDTYRVVLEGFAIGGLVGLVAGVVIGASSVLRTAFYPFLVSLYIMPKAVLIPLFLLWFGLGEFYKLLVIVLLVFFPVTENVVTGIRGVSVEMRELGRITPTTRWQTFRRISMPSMFPYFMAGLRIGITEAFIGGVLAEILAPHAGIGSRIAESVATSNTQFIMAGIIVIAFFGITTYFLMAFIERKLLFWYY